MEFKVTWSVDVVADSHTEAALDVAKTYFQKRIQQGHSDTACIFEVMGKDGMAKDLGTLVDLSVIQYDLNPEQLRQMYGPESHPGYSNDDWVDEVRRGDTLLGYWEWVMHKLSEERN